MDQIRFGNGSESELVKFVLLTFALSWSMWLWVIFGRTGPSSTSLFRLLGAFGPSLAAIILTGITGGKKSVRKLIGRLAQVQVPLRWYVVVLGLPLTISLLATGISVVLGDLIPDFSAPAVYEVYPLPPALSEIGVLVLFPFVFIQTLLFSSPMGEELGWRGYALPRLQAKWTALEASIILGIIWGIWHLPLFFTPGDELANQLFIWWFAGIIAHSILFTWVFNNTDGSVFLSLLFHTAISITSLFISSTEIVPFLNELLTIGIAILVVYRYGARTLTRNA